MKNQRHLILPIIVFIILLVSLSIISTINYSWGDWRPATCMTTEIGCFCEKIRDDTVRQPANTWSSLALTLLGFLVLAQARVDIRSTSNIVSNNPITTKYIYALIYGFSMIIIGLGSAFFHASLSFMGQTFDVLGMYLFVSFFIVYDLSRLYSLEEYITVILFISLNGVFAYFLVICLEFRRHIFIVALISALLLEIKLRRKKNTVIHSKYIIYAFVMMLISFIIWLLDTFKIICYPESLFQLHAIWHLSGTFAAGLLYLYFRSENTKIAMQEVSKKSGES